MGKFFKMIVYPALTFTQAGKDFETEFAEYVGIPGVDLRQPIGYSDLIESCSKCHYGFVGFSADGVVQEDLAYVQMAMPNKLFDCLASGIPVIAMNCNEVSKFVVKHDIGFVIDKPIGEWVLDHARDNYGRYWANVQKVRNQFTAEGEGEKLYKFYEKVLDA